VPRYWYLAGLLALAVAVPLIHALAEIVPWSPGWIGFVGTVIALLPAIMDMLRKFYVRRHAPQAAANPQNEELRRQVIADLNAAFLGYEPLYAAFYVGGLALIALGFARDLATR
jgi:hypothetical protein